MVNRILGHIFYHNWVAILYFNLRMLPWRQAIRFPFDFYHDIRFQSLSGCIVFEGGCVRRGMIKIGGRGSEMFPRSQTIIDLKGTWIIRGQLEVGHGALLRVENNGFFECGDNVRIGALTKVFCVNRITFGNEIDVSWECQIFDTNFHFLMDIESGKLNLRDGEISIGDLNWIGNRVSVMKGTRTPSECVVAANSLCNRDYTGLPTGSVIGGVPAQLLKTGKRRVFESTQDVPGF
ncbi:hypothetical protein [Uliginosibacterium gangwonense]|uniref:hypothetical protein n=1 Tax=Uliginosibacterium gangwonense TaxID=392736 RepID=UPI00035D9FC4|nr:hypothetical protein [Uliginosibacterium gangwonense]